MMKIAVTSRNDGNYIVFTGPMTCEHSREIENRIIDAMRHHSQLNVDLSGVEEIDLCGIHLLSVLHSYGGESVRIVATSPTVDAALMRLPSNRRHARLKQHIKPFSRSTPAMAGAMMAAR
jgi:anti-anti-sigma regulatory factor